MNDIAAQRCFRHPTREAVARCPECERYFCRECITEHADRVICAACLAALADRQAATAHKPRRLRLALQAALGLVALWLLFYSFGQILLRLPSAFHEGHLWRDQPWEEW